MLVVSSVLVSSLKAEGFPWRLARIFIGLVYHVLFVQYHRFHADRFKCMLAVCAGVSLHLHVARANEKKTSRIFIHWLLYGTCI